MRRHDRVCALVAFCVGLLSARSEEPQDLTLRLSTARPEVNQRVEIEVTGLPSGGNPFDPEAVLLEAEVAADSGKRVRVPGYFYRDYERRNEGDREVLTSSGEGWRIRVLPVRPGRHTVTVTARAGGRSLRAATATFEAVSGARPGLARVEPQGKRYFQTQDGSPLFLKGLCACWHGKRGTYDYDDWLAAYEKAGINYIRLWMWPEAFGIEWDKGDRLQYRMDNAWRLDRVLQEAERRGIYVMLCLDYHGIFEVKPDFWGGNNYWTRHPYNATNGGPCRTQNEFFTHPEAKKLYEKRLRYIAARWGAFPNLLAWEFFNEIDNEYAYVKHEDVVAWHKQMGEKLRALDPYEHLISSSFTGGSERPDLYALKEMDFAQYHSYNEKHPARMMAEKTAKFFQKYQKPFFVSEYGTDWKGWKPDTDPHLRALHQAIWSGVFTGAAGTGMTWWWESIHTADLYPHWSGLTRFLEGTGVGRAGMKPVRIVPADGKLSAFAVADNKDALVWLLDSAYDWPEGAMQDSPTALSGGKATLEGIADGQWEIEWWQTMPAERVSRNTAEARNGRLLLQAPDFRVDIAARLRQK